MSEQEQVKKDFNDAINHAISLGIEASQFLEYWREGDWESCKEFGFEVSESLRNPK